MSEGIPEPLSSGRLGLIAGNGRLPTVALEEAIRLDIPVTVAAIEEEADPSLSRLAQSSDRISLNWLGVGQMGRLLRIFSREGVDRAVMVGQVKHVRIFAPASRSPWSQLRRLPDRKMLSILNSLRRKDTSSLIEGIIAVLEAEGIQVLPSTLLLQPLLPKEGELTRSPTLEERQDWEYGFPIARKIAAMDLGQTIVVKDRAVVAVEAMEGTDATIRRAAELVNSERISVIKVSRPQQDFRYDLPVVGERTLAVLQECHVSALWIEAGRTLLLDRDNFLQESERADIAVVAFSTESTPDAG